MKEWKLSTLKEIENHWKEGVQSRKRPNPNSEEKRYIVPMFPYPSGTLHMGHVRVYAISDVLANYNALRGRDVIHPMGWDAFGLPAENAAMHHGLSASKWTQSNIQTMRHQLQSLGCSFDWDRELSTCSPDYYRWTQWMFGAMYRGGLAVRRWSLVNWDPVDRTVLADEQIDADGRSWRSGARAQKKPLRQWLLRTSVYAKEMQDALVAFPDWKHIVNEQRWWIGDCDVFRFELPLKLSNGSQQLEEVLELSLPDPEQMYKADFFIIKRSHILCHVFPPQNDGRLDLLAKHPLSDVWLPVICSDDTHFEEYLDARLGIVSESEEDRKLAEKSNIVPTSKSDTGLMKAVLSQLMESGQVFLTTRKLKDWVVSRQRYWGTPIPIIYCQNCGTLPVPQEGLPVTLPDLDLMPRSEDGRSPLEQVKKWMVTPCPKCGAPSKRESDTLDTFFDSTWYFLRYLDPKNDQRPFSPDTVKPWMPIHAYIGGKEHAVLHLFFARFVMRFLHHLDLVPTPEPFQGLISQGIILGKTLRMEDTGQYLAPEQVTTDSEGQMTEKKTGGKVVEAWEKMSKSRFNGVNPTEILDQWGADLTRLMILKAIQPVKDFNWNLELESAGVKKRHQLKPMLVGLRKWLDRLGALVNHYVRVRSDPVETKARLSWDIQEEHEARLTYNLYVRLVTDSLERTWKLNTGIGYLNAFTNALYKMPKDMNGHSPEHERLLHALVIMSSVFAPHLSAELWRALASVPPIHNHWLKEREVWEQAWPELDEDAIFDLLIKVDEEVVDRFAVDRRQIGGVTLEKALEMARGEVGVELEKRMGGRTLLNTSFTQIPNFGAELKFELEPEEK